MGGFSLLLSLLRDATGALTGSTGPRIAAWFLATTLLVSGVIKLRRPARAALAMLDFGVIRKPRPRFGLALGAMEVALAAALAVVPRLAAPLAAVLFATFVGLIGRSLLEGKSFACFCFGDGGTPLSWLTMVRTALLAGVAAGVSLAAPSSVLARPVSETLLELSCAVALLGIILLLGQMPGLVRWNRGVVRVKMVVGA